MGFWGVSLSRLLDFFLLLKNLWDLDNYFREVFLCLNYFKLLALSVFGFLNIYDTIPV